MNISGGGGGHGAHRLGETKLMALQWVVTAAPKIELVLGRIIDL